MRGRRAAAVGTVLALALGCSGPAAAPRLVLAVRDGATGHVRWSQELDPLTNGVDLLVLDGVLVRHGREMLVGQDLRDGHELWSVPGLDLPKAQLPDLLVSQDGRNAYGRPPAPSGSVLTAVTPAGRTAWSGPTAGTLVASRSAVMVVTKERQRDSSLVAMLDPRTGKPRWQVRYPGVVRDVNVGATPAVVVAVQTDDATGHQVLIGLSTRDGHRLWSRPVQGVSRVIDGDGAILLQTTAHALERVEPLTGAELWSAKGLSPLLLQPFVGVERSGGDAKIFRLDPVTGARLPGEAAFTVGGAARSDLLVGADAEVLTAVRGAKQVWTSRLPHGARAGTFVATDGALVATLTATDFPEYHD